MRTTLILVGILVLANTAIAGFLLFIGFGDSFGTLLVFSQSIGLCIAVLCRIALHLFPPGRRLLVAVIAAVGAGSLVGQLVARLLTGHMDDWAQPITFQSLLLGLVFGGLASVYYYLRERAQSLENELQTREQQRIEAEKRGIEAQLKMLQAQIEPHFLFNTLANVSALIESDGKLASRLLDALIRHLRASLARTRGEGGTLSDEMKLIGTYLEILQIRMGDRLSFQIDVPPALLDKAFPPMLLQPLVENAIIHGLEPLPEGGRIDIAAASTDGRLRITVRDTGRGFSASAAGGIGLGNVRARLQAIFGDAGKLVLSENEPRGVTATLEIPA